MTLTHKLVSYAPFEAISNGDMVDNLNFSPINGGIYQVTTNQARYLNISSDLEKVIYVDADSALPSLQLYGGNAKWSDNVINIQDASIVGGLYNIGDITDDADVNFDDNVNIQDLALVGGNFDLDSETAYADWLPLAYDGRVAGVVKSDDTTGEISGSVSGDYNLIIDGQFTGNPGPVSGSLEFTGTVSGDFSGNINGVYYERGVDPLYATITDTGAGETVRLVGNFVKSGIDGHFVGQVITGPELLPVTDVTISGLTTVAVGDTIDLDVSTTPPDRWVVWSVHANHADYASIDQDGVVTGLAEFSGDIEIIVVTVDDSGFNSASHYISVTD
jgi:hypothetical protein